MTKNLAWALFVVVVVSLAFGAGVLAAPLLQTDIFVVVQAREWNDWPRLAQLTYIAGVMDTLGLVDFTWRRRDVAYFGRISDWVTTCLAPAPWGRGKRADLEEVVRKWVRDNPDKRDWNMVTITVGSIRQMCE